MRIQGTPLTDADRRAVSEFLGGRALRSTPAGSSVVACQSPTPFRATFAASDWNGWGNGVENTRFARSGGLTAGDPPAQPNRMIKARIMADLPDGARPQIAVLNTLSPEFRALADRVRAIKGADFSICDVEAPVRIVEPTKPEPQAKKQRARRTARSTDADPAA